jgi:nucleotide-binding universal stress UspA family protein
MILCGTDLSPASDAAVKCAAACAKKRNRRLLLAHVVSSSESLALATAQMRLESKATELRDSYGISVATRAEQGATDERLLELACAQGANIIVVSALGSSGRRRSLGSVPERLCELAGVPVLIARDAAGLDAWSAHLRRLKVLVGSGLGDASRSALLHIASWPDVALTLAHVAWPYGEHYRLGVGLPIPLDYLQPEVHQQLLSDLGRWAGETASTNDLELRVIAGWGRIDSHLAELALEEEADLLVVGNHQRNLAERIWHGSVSRHAIHEASCNVLCVPNVSAAARVASSPRAVVVPTDFSALSDRAIPVGYSLLERGGTLHLVHVNSKGHPARDGALAQLSSRIPLGLEVRDLRSDIHVLDGSTPWLSIWQYAERANADLICMGTHSRDTLRTFVLGSQAQALLQRSHIPVVFVPPDRRS